MQLRSGSGVWELFLPDLHEGELYKFEIWPAAISFWPILRSRLLHRSAAPAFASVVYDRAGKHLMARRRLDNGERELMPGANRCRFTRYTPGRRKPDGEFLSYRELADQLIPYVREMGFTHIEFLPLAEHRYGPSWGYQISISTPQPPAMAAPEDLMELIDPLPSGRIGVILDWVPARKLPKDAHAMAWFDGTCVYEHADPRQGEHRLGDTDLQLWSPRSENFLITTENALYWLDT